MKSRPQKIHIWIISRITTLSILEGAYYILLSREIDWNALEQCSMNI